MNLFDVYPLFDITPVSAKGSVLKDQNGNCYLDLYGGHAVISIGHSHPHYIQRLEKQLKQIGFYSNSVQIPQQQELANLLAGMSGLHNFQLFLCNSGAEANENAMKLASFHTGKSKIIVCKKSFHGRTSLAVEATDDPKIQAPVNHSGNIIYVPLNDIEALESAFSDDIAAFLVEGIQGVAGIYMPDDLFLKKASELCRNHQSLLILDEVQSGYGRSGAFFAWQHSDIKPDIITIAKGMGNGFPVAGVLIAEHIKPKHSMLGTTFGGNYLACAAALAVLEVMEEEDLISQAAVSGNYLMELLKPIPGITEIRGRGLMLGIQLDRPAAEVRRNLLNQYKIFTGSASESSTIRLLPALNVEKEHLERFSEALFQVLKSA